MNHQLSIVIICRNEAHIIGKTIAAAKCVSDDIVVVDSGSTDGTQSIITNAGAQLLETGWEGYGINKNKGVAIAKHDWILSIDADEILDEVLIKELQILELTNPLIVYNIRFRAFLMDKMIRFGEWSGETHIRLYNRKHVHWNEAAVHEVLLFPDNTVIKNIRQGFIHHFTMKSMEDYKDKTIAYANLNAEKYFSQGKKAGWLKCIASPTFSFIKNYIFRLGFLDGSAGFAVAKMNAWYTWLKYTRLRELKKNK